MPIGRNKMRFHLLFEQSGTFKKVLQDKGHEAFDYDILDNYGQTDFKIDLFKEIENEYENIIGGQNQTTKPYFQLWRKIKILL